MSVTRQRPPGVGPPNEHDTTPLGPSRPLWQQFLIGAVGVLLVVGAILLVVRFWAIPALQSRGADTGIAGEATLAVLQTQQALTPRPTPTVAPLVQPTTAPTVAPTFALTLVPAVAPTAIPTARPTPTVAAVVSPAEITSPAPSATPLVGDVVEVNGTPVLAVNGTPIPLPTTRPEVAAAVSDAYQRYWSVRADALLNLDPTGLDQVAAGDELAALEKNIKDLRAQGRAVKTDVQHHLSVLTAFDDKALVSDRVRDSSVYVNPEDDQPLPGEVAPSSPDEAPEVTSVYELQLVDGTWKVVSSTWKVGNG
jgi:hypothetical protein